MPPILVNPGAPYNPPGGASNTSTGSGGFFSNIYQNIEDTIVNAKAETAGKSWWETTVEGIGNVAATLASTRLEQAKLAATTPVNVPQWFPPYWDQNEFPPEGTRGPNQLAAGVAPPAGNDKTIIYIAIAGVAALVFLRK